MSRTEHISNDVKRVLKACTLQKERVNKLLM